MIEIKSIQSEDFSKYGRILQGYDFEELLRQLCEITPKPEDSTVYKASEEKLEALEIFAELRNRAYGGMPIQIGYCNGHNKMMNCLEYHRDSELNIAADDCVLLLAPKQEIADEKIDSSKVEAFLLPKGVGVQLYETTLHYAPCDAPDQDGFRVLIVLPKGTNTEKPKIEAKNSEDRLLWAKNKWLLAHADSPEAKDGAHVGVTGKNIIV